MNQVSGSVSIRQIERKRYHKASSKTLCSGALEPYRGYSAQVDCQVGNREILSLLGSELNVQLAKSVGGSVAVNDDRKASQGLGRDAGAYELRRGTLDRQGEGGR